MGNYLIIGGASGIGKAIVTSLRGAGQNVFMTYNTSLANAEIEAQHHDVLGQAFDPSFLPEVLDGFVYCPGSIDLKPFNKLNPDAVINDLRLQVIGAIEILQIILPKLKAAEQASVVLFSSVAVQTGFNYHSQVAISKGAIEGLTRSLAAEFSPHIRVNAIAPSLTDTPLASRLLNTELKKTANADRHPLKRIGKAQDIADMAIFLLSDKSSWMTGQILQVDGGMSSIHL